MNVARTYGDKDPAELEGYGLSVLYALSAFSVGEEARDAVATAVASGERVSVAGVKEKIASSRKVSSSGGSEGSSESEVPPWEDDGEVTDTEPVETPAANSHEEAVKALSALMEARFGKSASNDGEPAEVLPPPSVIIQKPTSESICNYIFLAVAAMQRLDSFDDKSLRENAKLLDKGVLRSLIKILSSLAE